MSESHQTFMEQLLTGKVLPDEIDDFVEAWHTGSGTDELHEFLGMSWTEYALWVQDPAYLSLIVTARSRGQDIRAAVNDNYLPSLRSAGRAEDGRAERLEAWLAHG